MLENFPTEYNTSFAVVRNTYSRFVSSYYFARSTHSIKLQRRLIKNNSKNIEYLKESVKWLDKGIIPWLQFNLDYSTNITYSLLTWIKNVDIILHQETLHTDFKAIQHLINCYCPLEKNIHINYYDSEYSTAYIKFIDTHWSSEIEYFKYAPAY